MNEINKTGIIAADIGGTNFRVAGSIISEEGSPVRVTTVFEGATNLNIIETLVACCREELSAQGCERFVLSIGTAGVIDGTLIHHPEFPDQRLDLYGLVNQAGIKSWAIRNDFEMEAWGVRDPNVVDSLMPFHGPDKVQVGASLVVGPGTGLGGACIRPGGEILRTELGNTPVASPRTPDLQKIWPDILRHLRERFGVECPRYEDIVAGRGLTYLWSFFAGEELEPEEVVKKILQSANYEPFSIMAEMLVLACHNLAPVLGDDWRNLRNVFISGGVARKNVNPLFHARVYGQDGPTQVFASMFDQWSVLRAELAGNVGVFLVQNEHCGLYGAAQYAVTMIVPLLDR
ncbi:glucokinase [bacterium]|nr:glucokinase [bacterium]